MTPRVRVVLSLGLPDPDRISTTLLWSLLGHTGLLLGVLIWQSLPSRAVIRDAPYFVRLAAPAAPPGGGGAASAPVRPIVPIEEAPTASKPTPPKPEPPKASPPKPAPSKASVPPPESTRKPSPRPAPHASESSAHGPDREASADERPAGSTGASGGGSGGRGAGPGNGPAGTGVGGTSFGEGDFQYDWYRSALEAKLRAAWRPPIASSPQAQVATVGFTIRRDGSVQEVSIVTPGGNDLLDLSVVRAVYDAAPLPPLPRTWNKDSVHVSMEFQLTPGGG